MKRFEAELKWIKLLHAPPLLGFSDNIDHALPQDFDVPSLLEFQKRKS